MWKIIRYGGRWSLPTWSSRSVVTKRLQPSQNTQFWADAIVPVRSKATCYRPVTSITLSRCKSSSSPATPYAESHCISRALLGLVGGVGTAMILLFPEAITSPLQCDAPDYGPKSIQQDLVDRVLYAEASETYPTHLEDVTRFDSVRVASNSPSEDQYIFGKIHSEKSQLKWTAWGIFDGHAGSQVSVALAKYLLDYVKDELVKLPATFSDDGPRYLSSIEAAIKRAFVSLDKDIMSPGVEILKSNVASLAEKIAALSTAYSGSCALLCLYDSSSRQLRVACTGDSRAVLATQDADGFWLARNLSIDQDGNNSDEVARLQALHPNEPNMVRGKRLLGIAVTRAFGDSPWKWDREVQEEAHRAYNGAGVRPDSRSPPYLTAEPEVTTTELECNKPSFVILASDGLWEHMTSQQAVDLVGKWLSWNAAGKPDEQLPSNGFGSFDFGRDPDDPELEYQIRPEWATVKDSNAAVHLVRNGMGEKNENVVKAILGFGLPRCRYVRDDTTVQVIFFGTGWGRQLS